MNKSKIIGLMGAAFVAGAVTGALRQSGATCKHASRIQELEREVAMKEAVLADQRTRLMEFEQNQNEEAAGAQTKAFLQWYDKDMKFRGRGLSANAINPF